ncbi:hypothetical protein [Nonomuraea sp. NPDC003804]|uniref:hypothetical protein n=1 Tax=Nonomuraea sp. NPDC003804 TaxID=3154547 RepID=UPI0033B64D1C
MPCREFDTPAGVDAKYAELVEAGHRGIAEPFDAFWGMHHTTVADPDSGSVGLYAVLPAS